MAIRKHCKLFMPIKRKTAKRVVNANPMKVSSLQFGISDCFDRIQGW